MKASRLAVGLVALAAGIVGVVVVSGVMAEDVVSLDDVPAAVRNTITQHVVAGQPVEIERETEGGQVVYEVEQEIDGQEVEFQVSATGEYLGQEAEEADDDNEDEDDDDEQAVSWAELPKVVQDGLAAALAGATPATVTREMEGGSVVYEAEYEAEGAEQSVTVTEDGELIESEQEISVAELPEAVSARLQSIESASIEEVELVTVTFYEIEFKDANGKEREIRLYANGQELDDD